MNYRLVTEEDFKSSIQRRIDLFNLLMDPQFMVDSLRGYLKILECFRCRTGKLILAGNGGSCADASHFSEELVGKFQKKRRSYPSIVLDSSPALSCIANDFGYSEVFSRQLEALAFPQDLVILMSTSGNSLNILKAIEVCRRKDVPVFLMTGYHPKFRNEALSLLSSDEKVCIPSSDTDLIQEGHKFLIHSWLSWIDRNETDESSNQS